MILNMLKKFYLFFLLFILNSAYSNDLCNLLLNDNFIVPEVSINDGFAVITRVEIKNFKIHSQSTLSEITFDQRTYFPNDNFTKFINNLNK